MRAWSLRIYDSVLTVGENFKIRLECLPDGNRMLLNPLNTYRNGAITLIKGLSGSGKTTLLRELYGKLKQDKTGLVLESTPANITAGMLSVAYIPQIVPVLKHWYVTSIVPNDQRFFQCFFPGYEIEEVLGKKIGEFSGGEQKRIYLWSALENLASQDSIAAFMLIDETLDAIGAHHMGKCLLTIIEEWQNRLSQPLHLVTVTHLTIKEVNSIGINPLCLSLTLTTETRDKIITQLGGIDEQ